MPTRLIFLTALLLLTFAAPASAVIVPNKGMAGVELGDCIEATTDTLGYPDKTFGKTDVFGFVSTYTYATEVPEGYVRVGFWELQPDPDQPELPVGPKALAVAGQKIFIKGYMHPGVASRGKVNHFILVPDMGTCCFGGQPKMTDMIEVVSPASEGIAYSTRRVKLAGTFALHLPPTQTLGLDGVVFHLQADRME